MHTCERVGIQIAALHRQNDVNFNYFPPYMAVHIAMNKKLNTVQLLSM